MKEIECDQKNAHEMNRFDKNLHQNNNIHVLNKLYLFS